MSDFPDRKFFAIIFKMSKCPTLNRSDTCNIEILLKDMMRLLTFSKDPHTKHPQRKHQQTKPGQKKHQQGQDVDREKHQQGQNVDKEKTSTRTKCQQGQNVNSL